MIGCTRLVDNESAIVAGSGVVPEDEVEAAIAFRRTLAWRFNIHITLLIAIIQSRQEIEGSSVSPPDSPKQLSFKNRLTSDQKKSFDVIILTNART